MALNFTQASNPERFMNPHVLHTKTSEGRELFVLSGVVVIDLKGVTDEEWRWETVTIVPSVPTPAGTMLVLDQVAPFVTVNSFLNLGQSVNSGFAVDAFHISAAGNKLYGGLPIAVNCAVRDSDAFLYRLGYTVTLTGTYEASDIHIE